MQRWGQQLRSAWIHGLLAPRLAAGWAGVILGLGALRWWGRRPGQSLVGWCLALLVIGLMGRQLWRVGRALLTQAPGDFRSTPNGGRRVLAWAGLGLTGGILALPWGLWGLSSRFWVRLPMPATLVNWVTLNRRPVLVVSGLLYLALVLWGVIWGPRHLPVTAAGHRGTSWQMLSGLGVQVGLLASWFAMSLAVVAVNRLADRYFSAQVVRWVTRGSLLVILAGFTLAALLGAVTLIWSWCGQPLQRPIHPHWALRWPFWGLVVSWLVISGAVVEQTVRQPDRFQATVTISHRGVDHGVGVQNTLGALRHVHQEHPRYVEMDLHETRDHRWVVLHDENLQQLAGRSVTPHQLTLRQLERLTVRENGQSARLVGWDRYLQTAEDLRQPLLVELKTTPQDSPGMIRRFARAYGRRLTRDRSAVHSLDYRVVAQLRRDVPALRVGYITPFNWVAPSSVPADFYSFQRLSVSDQFVAAAHAAHAPAYLWTPDSPAAMTRLWALGADGQITNELSRLQRVVTQPIRQAWWAVVMNFVLSYI